LKIIIKKNIFGILHSVGTTMQITKQTNPNECGICAINSLVDHYYHHNDKNVILNEAKLTSDGLSIFNFEVLSQKFGLFAETYQLE
jgi:ABC-type bacteriocin/lantibiotic exporter with double-glycine peptidase domain